MEVFEYRGYPVNLIAKPIKHCYLRVKPDGVITLTHNKWLKKSAALELIDKNWSLIETKLSKLPKPNNLLTGSEVYFLGQQYLLQIILDKQKKIEIVNNWLYLFTPTDDYATKRKIIDGWYVNEAKSVLLKQYEDYLVKVNHWPITTPVLLYRTMKRRWGSYNKTNNTITLNTTLVKAGREIIDYIIAHELCHTLHFNHSKAFYNELSKLHPTWMEQKRELESLSYKF
jgi:predicted metal-dependent hydrolase